MGQKVVLLESRVKLTIFTKTQKDLVILVFSIFSGKPFDFLKKFELKKRYIHINKIARI